MPLFFCLPPVHQFDPVLDELLDDDFESEYENEDQPKKLDSSLKIADDEYGDTSEESWASILCRNRIPHNILKFS